MNCGSKSGGHKYSPYNRLCIEILHFVSRLATVSLSHIRENLLKMWNASSIYISMYVCIYIYIYIFGDCVSILCQYRRCLRFQTPQVSSYSSGFHGNSEVPGPFLPLRVSSYSCPSLHLFAALENPTLRLE